MKRSKKLKQKFTHRRGNAQHFHRLNSRSLLMKAYATAKTIKVMLRMKIVSMMMTLRIRKLSMTPKILTLKQMMILMAVIFDFFCNPC